MRVSVATKIGAGFALAAVGLTAVGVTSYRATMEMGESQALVSHTLEVAAKLNSLEASLVAGESAQRVFIITGDEAALAPYNAELNRASLLLQEVQTLTADNPVQQSHVTELRALVSKRTETLDDRVAARREQGFEAAAAGIAGGRGLQLAVEIRRTIEDMKDVERRLLDRRSASAAESARRAAATALYGGSILTLLLGAVGFTITRSIGRPLRAMTGAAEAVASGDLTARIAEISRSDEVGTLSRAFAAMLHNLRENERQRAETDWMAESSGRVLALLPGRRDLRPVATTILAEIAALAGAQYGLFYLAEPDDEGAMALAAGYACGGGAKPAERFGLGEGLAGQCARERKRILLTDVPADYLQVGSGLGAARAVSLVLLPIVFEDRARAVIELAALRPFGDLQLRLLDQLAREMGPMVDAVAWAARTEQLLGQSRQLAEELRSQQEELQAANEELEEKASLLEARRGELERKNHELELARAELQDRAAELARASAFKSEFLANMSHELRTPLNSLLILSQLMAENAEGNLTPKQVEYAATIHASGSELLALINDILDLSKIESGALTVDVTHIPLSQLRDDLERTFRPVAVKRGIAFEIEIAPELPAGFLSDILRVEQVLKNFLSNAFKFTEKGSVEMRIEAVNGMWAAKGDGGDHHDGAVAFHVRDTGIGIPEDRMSIIFDAFRQGDGTTSRRYGGTGLGLAISRELARLLGGEIRVQSEVGRGSTFTLYLPLAPAAGLRGRSYGGTAQAAPSAAAPDIAVAVAADGGLPETAPAEMCDPAAAAIARSQGTDPILAGRTVLVVDDDIRNIFAIAAVLEQWQMKVVFAENGKDALAMLESTPGIDIVLMDVMMPEMDGYETTRAIREKAAFRKLPIIALTAKAMKGDRDRCVAAGASDYISKPVDTEKLMSLMRVWLCA